MVNIWANYAYCCRNPVIITDGTSLDGWTNPKGSVT